MENLEQYLQPFSVYFSLNNGLSDTKASIKKKFVQNEGDVRERARL